MTTISETSASSKSGRMDAVRLKNAGTIDMSAPPDAFGASHRAGLLNGGTIQTHLRIETLAGNGLQLRLCEHQILSTIPGEVPEDLCLQRVSNRVVQLPTQFASGGFTLNEIRCHQSSSEPGLQ
ncbi:hypothetical protein [Paraburkholderia sp. MM5384-R2]|uniref:hypothetical protein n=1 Tax=Paraburkholderia sp. MM5384-R2 TaxID=2723097 RepID=UPI00160E6253|nr:hypothetical protein [Paraburkholderia sp. MM5384-R2]MBB5498759.1 hypothetical protein [Paraburkholderia sp. MM5384-R2]